MQRGSSSPSVDSISLIHHLVDPGGDRGDDPGGVAAGGAAGAVDVVLDRLGHLEVDDVADAGDVEAAGGDVGRHQDAVLALAEALERLRPLPLGEVGVDALDRVPLALSTPESHSASLLRRMKTRVLPSSWWSRASRQAFLLSGSTR